MPVSEYTINGLYKPDSITKTEELVTKTRITENNQLKQMQ